MTSAAPGWQPHIHADRRPFLMGRNRLMAAFRLWFAERDFVEVETAALQVSPGNEAHLHAFATQALTIDGRAFPFYLHTSPEFAAKKLLAAGETRLCTFAHVWRNRERGPLHHPEFTMLEWYRAGETYDQLMTDCADLLKLSARTPASTDSALAGHECDPFTEPERLTVADAFARHAGIDLLATIRADGTTDHARRWPSRCARNGLSVSDDDTWADLFSKVIVGKVEPHLGMGRATILANIPPPKRPSPGALPRMPVSPNASSSMPAGWNWPMPSAN